MKHHVVLFQPYLRKHIVNFGKYLKGFEFVVQKPTSGNFYKTQLPASYEKEIHRIKTSRINKLRRFFGLLNVRIKFDAEADMFFTYGCMLLTNKPYCVYIENGVALYNYDTKIAAHPLAQLLFSFLVRRKNLKKLIFMSAAGQKSFFATVPYSEETRTVIEQKSIQIYPLIEKKNVLTKKDTGLLKLLFAGIFYMKGGIELAHAFTRIRERYDNVLLTIVTPLSAIKESDIEMMRNIPGLTLTDANLNENQMNELYQSHDIFMLPTFRDGFGLVLVEAISWGMPIICTDQYATIEAAIHDYNALVYPNHPLKDYDTKTYQLLGKYYNPKDFYTDLFRLQKENALKPIEDFLYISIEAFLLDPKLLEKYSRNSLELYNTKFHQDIISERIESVFLEAVEK
ncbi:MAG TPA: glycosyltransferase family 4 protein [Patescibacteria group bacterium]|nr:glycosyltransferase family 4 protein [Patescibacteria group bacterium]